MWNVDFGVGIFKCWSKIYKDMAIIENGLGITMKSRKELTEFEIEPESFNPPV